MKTSLMIIIVVLVSLLSVEAQTKRVAVRKTPKRSTAPVRKASTAPFLGGSVAGRTYTNRTLGFEITFPDTWLIADDDYYAYMKKHGFDLTPKPPKASNPADQAKMNAAFNRLKILLTVYRSMPGTEGNAVARVAAENVRQLDTSRPVKDAVDYVDLMRSQMGQVKMPVDYKYSETQAEQLGSNQFAYIDSSDKLQKTRVYVTVRGGYALLFSLYYTADEDLETFRDTLARANFALK
jgi:hypothetical protein